jgi:hypothetical protein
MIDRIVACDFPTPRFAEDFVADDAVERCREIRTS